MKQTIILLAGFCLIVSVCQGQVDSTETGSLHQFEADSPLIPDINALTPEGTLPPVPKNLDRIREAIGYPDSAVGAGIQGMVVARVLVDTAGHCADYRILKKAHPYLSNEVEKQVMNLTFTPATRNEKAVFMWVNIPFAFVLMDSFSDEDFRRMKLEHKAEKKAEKQKRKRLRKQEGQ